MSLGQNSSHHRAVLMLLAASMLWGTTGTAASFAEGASPLAIGAASLGIGGLLQAVAGIRAMLRHRAQLGQHRGLILAGAAGVLAYPLAFYSSMHLGGVALGTVISLGSAPLFSGLLERIMDGAQLSRRWYLAAALGIAGSTLLGMARADGAGSGLMVAASCLLGLLAGASYALYSWAAGRIMAADIPRSAAVGAVFGGGGLLLMPADHLYGSRA